MKIVGDEKWRRFYTTQLHTYGIRILQARKLGLTVVKSLTKDAENENH